MRVLAAGALFVLAVASTAAMAADVMVGGVSITLPAPAGFCELSANNPVDSRAVTALSGMLAQSGNMLLGISADCQELTDWRAGRRLLLDDYA